jgi:hypothetical protein
MLWCQDLFYTKDSKPLMEPTIDRATSVQMLTHFFQDIFSFQIWRLDIECMRESQSIGHKWK